MYFGSLGADATSTELAQILADDPALKAAYVAQSVQGQQAVASAQAAALRPFRTALAKRATNPVDIFAIGDSITEGQGASSINNRWVQKVTTGLRSRYQPGGITGGFGFAPAVYYSGPADKPTSVTAGSPAGFTYGPGRRETYFTDATKTMTITAICTGLDLFYITYPGFGIGYYTVDGGAATTFNTNAAQIDGNKVTIRGLSAGSHTIVVGWSSGGQVMVDGAMIYNGDEASGIRLWEGGHGGQQSSYFADPTKSAWLQFFNVVQPSLVLVELGVNDFFFSTPPATMKTNLQTLVSNIRAHCTVAPSIVLVPLYERMDTFTKTYPWTQYVQAMYDLVSADGAVGLVDLYPRIGPQAELTSGLFASDKVHPSDAGHQFIADAVMGYLAP